MFVAFSKKSNPLDIKICSDITGVVVSINPDNSKIWLVTYGDRMEHVEFSEYDMVMCGKG